MKTASLATALVCASIGLNAITLPLFAQKPAAIKSGSSKEAAAKPATKPATKPTATNSTASNPGGAGVASKGFSGELTEIAKSNNQWTGIAVSRKNRVFVCFPRWASNVPVSVGELLPDGSVTPFPDKKWNAWINGAKVTGEEFVCIQSVYCDNSNNLWILDPAAPQFLGPVTDGPKLVKFSLSASKVDKTFPLSTVAPKGSYLNDVRIDGRRQVAYMTDSGLGAIVVLDLKTGTARRLLDTSPSTKAEDVRIDIDGKRWGVQQDGSVRKINSDGIALDKGGEFLYYQALTGKTLCRVATKDLLNTKLSAADLNKKVEQVAKTCVADGIEFGDDGMLYITSLEDHAIKRIDPVAKVKKLETVIQDKQLIWPDTLAMRGDGYFYVTTSQINLGPKPATPYKVFRFKPKK